MTVPWLRVVASLAACTAPPVTSGGVSEAAINTGRITATPRRPFNGVVVRTRCR